MGKKNQIFEKSSQQVVPSSVKDTRRSFLKKAAYSAPVLLALGQLTLPARVGAESHVPDPVFSQRRSRRPPE